MAVTNYISSNGMIIGEETNGVFRAYGLDALGSVVATYTGSTVENTYQYKPYGSTLAKTGTAADPSFLWNGGSGYRATTLPNCELYVRARHYSSVAGTWTSVDFFWPDELGWAYAFNDPVIYTDSSGKKAACCCHVDSATISIVNFTGGSSPLESKVTLSGQATNQAPKKPPKSAGCTLHWWEKSNHPNLWPVPNQWYDIGLGPGSPNAYFQNQLPTGCPGGGGPTTLPFMVVDYPSVPPQVNYDRILCIKPKLYWSTGGCHGHNSKSYLVWQVVHCDSTKCIVSNSGSSTNSNADAYCGPADGGTWP